MKAVVIAAGQGTRMGPLTENRPKPLLPIAGTPIVEHVLEAAAPYVDGYVLVVGYEADQIRDHFGTEFAGHPVEYAEQTEQLGTAHAIEQARPFIENDFLTLNGDVYITDDLMEALAAEAGTAMTVMPVDSPQSYGVVDLAGNQVKNIVEKPDHPPSNLANLGLYRFTPAIFDYIEQTELSERGEYEITASLEQLLDEKPVTAVEYEDVWLDIGRPWELLEATTHVLEQRDRAVNGDVEPNATLDGTVIVESGARVRNGSYIEGPTLIQAGADVGPNAYIRGHTVIGPNVRVGNAVEIKNSVLFSGTTVGHQSYVGDSVLGSDVNFGAGTNVANLRHDDDPIQVQVKEEMVNTGRRKLGVIVGGGTKTGINTSLNPGVTLGTNARTTPGEVVSRDKNRE